MTALAPASRRITPGWPVIVMPARNTAASPAVPPPARKTAPRLTPTTITPLTLTSIADDGVFEGYASLFHREDLGHDVVLPGAFRDTLRTRGARGVRLLFQHDPATPIGVWETLREDARGLFVRGRLTLGVARAREVLELMRAGAVDGLSIGFKTAKARRDRVRGIRLIEAVDLWEISIVTFPLLPGARITAVAQQTAPPAVRSATTPIATRGQAQPLARPADSLHDTAHRLLIRIEQRNRALARRDLKSTTALRSSIAGDRCLLALTRAALLEQHRLAARRARADAEWASEAQTNGAEASKANFNPGQLRIPSGQPGGGQWTNGDAADPFEVEDAAEPFTSDDHDEPLDQPNETWPSNIENEIQLAAAKGKSLTPGQIEYLYRGSKGHHHVPLADTKLRSKYLSPEAVDVFSRSSVGPNGELKNQSDPNNPHKGYNKAQRESNRATREHLDRYMREEGINGRNRMTGPQAREVVDQIQKSEDPRIKNYLRSLDQYIKQQKRSGRFGGRSFGRGGRGLD